MSRSLRRPRIAINCDLGPAASPRSFRRSVTLYEPYVRSVTEAGGLPILVPPSPKEVLKEYLDLADGLLFTGGNDYPPKLYGEKALPQVEVQARERSESDLRLMRLALKDPKPALGICAGLQLLNITAGGALIQHLPSAKTHVAVNPERDSAHPIEIFPGTQLAKLLGAGRARVNSSHHQAADPGRLAKGLKVSARAPDGTIEALELAKPGKRFFVFVQWHPERILDDSHRRRLFKAFVDACRK